MSSRHRCLALAALLLAAAPAGRLPAQTDASATDAGASIRSAYRNFDSAFKSMDADAVMDTFTPGFQATDDKGKVSDYAQTKAGVAGLFHVMSTPTQQNIQNTLTTVGSSVESLQVAGDTATARVLERIGWTERGTAISGIYQDHLLVVTDVDQWTLTPDGWKMARSRAVRSRLSAGPVQGVAEAKASISAQDERDRFHSAMSFANQMRQMQDDQFNESMFQSHMRQINNAISNIPRY